MIKYLLSYLLAGLLFCPLTSSGQNVFQKLYVADSTDQGHDVIQTSSHDFLIIGSTKSFGVGQENVYLIKTDSLGNLLWANTYGGNGRDIGRAITETYDNKYLIAGETNSFGAGKKDFYLLKIDTNGQLLWSKTYGGSKEERCKVLNTTSDSGIVLGGYTTSFGAGEKDFYIVKTDKAGNIEWKRTYGTGERDRCSDILETGNKNLLVIGVTAYRNYKTYNLLIKTDPFGDTLWTHFYFPDYYSPVGQAFISPSSQSNSEYTIFTGDRWGVLYREDYSYQIDSAGNLLWAKTYPGEPLPNNFILTSNNNHIALVGIVGRQNLYTIHFSKQGEITKKTGYGLSLRKKQVWGTDFYDRGGLYQTKDSGFLLVPHNSYTSDSNIFLIKTDPMANSTCDSTYTFRTDSVPFSIKDSIVKTNSGGKVDSALTKTVKASPYLIDTCGTFVSGSRYINKKTTNNYISVYPNPFERQINVVLSKDIQQQNRHLYVINIRGRKVYQADLSFNQQKITLPRSLPKGLYLLKIKNEDNIYTRKIIKQ